ncbi:hypothetical protein NLM27_26545 [Bradyrhizobium sp. CCGB12]|uniref:hypothetical protein n=1 Tax=Bradyrhizobium sp. CCGB12 TaxID=2949632 RepID=UPI0020B40044|nr:hypothetical protein [Bradyrhizobium sp. CCGB12]MCP3392313.1 hypothetical protein [Bradyrhizobium sp. CCGB12]
MLTNRLRTAAAEYERRRRTDLPFQDLAWSLYVFLLRLDAAISSADADHVLFLSREGKPLKEMFDAHRKSSGARTSTEVQTHYFRVSRKSTFLLSCGPLEGEQFANLFRQYRRISLADFLRSLSLDDAIDGIADNLRKSRDRLEETLDDLPTSPEFAALMKSERFAEAYAAARTEGGSAFSRYLSDIFRRPLPRRLYVVDVGWKGTIQDNLFLWFERWAGGVDVIGHYFGLAAPGHVHPRNKKHGLLFSHLDRSTPSFPIFNENRSLFEIMLPADHGAPSRYTLDANGNYAIIYDEFVERQLIEKIVSPVAQGVMSSVERIRDLHTEMGLTTTEVMALTLQFHKRLVFRPTSAELDWIASIWHFENFGVFEQSRLMVKNDTNPLDRIRFTLDLLRHRRLTEEGFWPYLTIRRRAVPGAAFLYGRYRMWQALLAGSFSG